MVWLLWFWSSGAVSMFLFAVFALFLSVWFIYRLCVVVKTGRRHQPGRKGSVSVLVVAGSGGHTTEILRLMDSLPAAYAPRHYVIADTDKMSEEKICTFESLKLQPESQPQYTICRIPRSREVHQSWSSSVVSTLNALWYSLPLVFRLRPDMKPTAASMSTVKFSTRIWLFPLTPSWLCRYQADFILSTSFLFLCCVTARGLAFHFVQQLSSSASWE